MSDAALTPEAELALLLKPAGGGLYLVSTGKAAQLSWQRRYYGAGSDADVTAAFLQTLGRLRTARGVLLAVPSDTGAGFRRGASRGPQALRDWLVEHDTDWPGLLTRHGVIDAGDVFVVPQLLSDAMLSDAQRQASQDALYPELPVPLRRALPVSPLSIAERALDCMLQLNPALKFFVVGGDHSVALPVVRALHARGRRFGIVQSDAHTDLLAERLGVRECFATWSYHANALIGRSGRLVQVGTRASQRPRAHWESTLDVRQFWADTIRAAPAQVLDDVVARARDAAGPDGVYFSNDIDGTDPLWAAATGTCEPDGLDPEWVVELIRRLGQAVGLVGGDVVEVAPDLAPDPGPTLQTAARYLRETVAAALPVPPV